MLHSRRFYLSFSKVCLLVSFFFKHLKKSISTLWRNKFICLSCFFLSQTFNFAFWIFSKVNTSCYVNNVMFSSYDVNATRITACLSSKWDVRNIYIKSKYLVRNSKMTKNEVLRKISSAPRDLKLFVGLLERFNKELVSSTTWCVFPAKHEKTSSDVLKEIFS